MVSFLEMSPAELDELPDTIEPLTLVELRSLVLALDGDTFAPGSLYDKGLASATGKLDRMLDEVCVKVLRARRGAAE
ncbi:hypothetical protein CTQ51_13495 [Salmonella enterica subsp. enterica serovar Infantis]|uniref:hypothetical protein n=1 Tax=Xanthomonas axonopodis TaxID=53413 RepID=UPI001EBA8CFC|nr:hypothetical protein [Salmonella enterica subsp. enterica serovar Infantis]EDL8717220.1 hypothetical protein [Salmonella enterica subsp. enterica serovar Infantis]EDL9232168.1 hypothetical protein [Salmonella enterica subsp. enterica serovar Infantis]EDL9351763.1 hypothetical protein [Salmonella enterica subsp. enterica serovar Infantis]